MSIRDVVWNNEQIRINWQQTNSNVINVPYTDFRTNTNCYDNISLDNQLSVAKIFQNFELYNNEYLDFTQIETCRALNIQFKNRLVEELLNNNNTIYVNNKRDIPFNLEYKLFIHEGKKFYIRNGELNVFFNQIIPMNINETFEFSDAPSSFLYHCDVTAMQHLSYWKPFFQLGDVYYIGNPTLVTEIQDRELVPW